MSFWHVLVDLMFLWSVNKLARAVTKWTKSCDKRLMRLISHIHHTSEHRQHCYVGNTAQQCRLGLCQDSDFAGDLQDSKSTTGGVLCIFRESHFRSNELDVQETDISVTQLHRSGNHFLDAGLRMDGISALALWDLVIEVFHSVPNQTNKTKDVREPRRNLSANHQQNVRKQIPTTHTNLDLTNTDNVPSNGTHSGSKAVLYVFEDNEAVTKMIIKKPKSHNETCVKNPQSCFGLVV